ncbi:MaoC family dehydratase [Tepidamorphus sp. 3E244]|uniref:MaoC family dehydratase n=1 Tax=Tepidamorphus sp. 3E244 TaxID=3385498 RepID=UPI0038FD30F2
MTKTNSGNFFEDFHVDMEIFHATPRTVTTGDVALYTALYGGRFAVQSADSFAQSIGYERSPVDDLLVFHIVFGKTVPDISLNAIANLGYAGMRFLQPVYPGDTLHAVSRVIGVKETSKGDSGIVYVSSRGFNQDDEPVLEYVRWVLVRKRAAASPAPEAVVPTLPAALTPEQLGDAVPFIEATEWNADLSGSPHFFEDYKVGEHIDHVDGFTIEEAEHQLATRLYQNTAKVHFNQHTEGQGRFGRRLVYGGHVISMVRSITFNGLGNAFHFAAVNGGRHVNPAFAGDTIYAWSEITDAQELAGREGTGALRVRSVGVKNRSCADFPLFAEGTSYDASVVLDLDYWVLMPRRG